MLPRSTKFSKYQALGNDFVILDRRSEETSLGAATARALCERKLGVGADGVLSLRSPEFSGADVRMEVHNADGSPAETCGNGLRCLVGYVLRDLPEYSGRTEIVVETGAGTRGASLVRTDGPRTVIRAEMAPPVLEASEIPVGPPLPASGRIVDVRLEAGELRAGLTALSMGNPHAVVFHDDPREALEYLGPRLVSHPAFPRGVNVGVARVDRGDHISLCVWERGVGPTSACGSGACAAAIAARLTGRTDGPSIEVNQPGGSLIVDLSEDLGLVHMTGPAIRVFEGVLDLRSLSFETDEACEHGAGSQLECKGCSRSDHDQDPSTHSRSSGAPGTRRP